MMSVLTHIFVRRYAHHHALLIVFLSSAIWGVLWVPMRYAESFGISGLWVVTLFHLLPAIAILPFIARAYIADRRHRLVSLIAGGLLGCLLVMRVNPLSFDYDKADLLGLAAGMAWALGSVVIRRFPNADFLHITFMQYSVGGLLAGTAAFVMGDMFPETHRLISVLPVAFLASTVVFLPSVLLIFRIMQYVSPGLVGILMLSEVLVAALSSWLFLQEALTLSQWAGVLAILGTGVFVGLTEKAAES